MTMAKVVILVAVMAYPWLCLLAYLVDDLRNRQKRVEERLEAELRRQRGLLVEADCQGNDWPGRAHPRSPAWRDWFTPKKRLWEFDQTHPDIKDERYEHMICPKPAFDLVNFEQGFPCWCGHHWKKVDAGGGPAWVEDWGSE